MVNYLVQLPLMGTALALGLRHGLDLDHIAALVDICGSSGQDSQMRKKGLWLSLAYVFGHAFVISLLGLAAISFAAVLPVWIDAVMERVVGLTLVILGLYLLNTVFGAKTADFKIKSGWSALYSHLRQIIAKLTKQPKQPLVEEPALSSGATFFIGMLHGIGAETATQVLLMSAVAGADSLTAIAMLVCFVLGLVISNSIIAFVSLGGFGTASNWRVLYLVGGGLAGAFSLFIGSKFLLGLPE